MSLTIEELSDLEDSIMKELPNKITGILTKLNTKGLLEDFLEMIGMSDLLNNEEDFYSFKDGKIVVVGGTELKEKILVGIVKELGLDKERFEFCLEYDDIQKYNFKKMQYAPQYRVILMGPTPHSGHGKGDSRSIVSELENTSGYPRVVRLVNGQELKISKTNFKEALVELISENYI